MLLNVHADLRGREGVEAEFGEGGVGVTFDTGMLALREYHSTRVFALALILNFPKCESIASATKMPSVSGDEPIRRAICAADRIISNGKLVA